MAPLEGPVGVGALVDAIFLGCVFAQSCAYYKNSRGDAWLLKVLVSLILFFLLSHLGCMVAWLWASTQANSEDVSVPGYATVLFGVSGVIGATILFLERSFFSHRILRASNNHLLAVTSFILCIFSFTAAMGAACVFFVSSPASLTGQLGISWIFPVVIITGLLCDLAISTVTAFYLKSQTPVEVSDASRRVSGLLILIAETGFATSIVDVAVVLVYWLTKSNYAWMGLFVAMPGVFANTLLAALNARGSLCADIEHQRTDKIADKFIDGHAKKPPIKISISRKIEKRSERIPV